MADIMTAIQTLGFPIAMVFVCLWYINKQDTIHRDEVTKLSDAIANNTIIMQKLADKLERIGGAWDAPKS